MYIFFRLLSYVRQMVSIELLILFSFWSPDKVCANGKYGQNCTGRCSSNCLDGACDHVDGRCAQGCNPGYQGTTCSNGNLSLSAKQNISTQAIVLNVKLLVNKR